MLIAQNIFTLLVQNAVLLLDLEGDIYRFSVIFFRVDFFEDCATISHHERQKNQVTNIAIYIDFSRNL